MEPTKMRSRRLFVPFFAALFVGAGAALLSQTGQTASLPKADAKDWIQLFNGRNLDGWTPKFAKHDLGENYNDTFRVENGLLKVRYDKWTTLRRRVRPHVLQGAVLATTCLAAEYRFVGEQVPGGPGLGDAQQRPDAPRPDPEDDAEGSGLPDLDRGPAARRARRRQAADDAQPVHAGHERRHERRARHAGTASTRSRRPTTAISGCAWRCSCTATS